MLRARYPLVALTTFAAAAVGFTFFTGRSTSASFEEVIRLQADQIADLVANVASSNERLRRKAERNFRRLDALVANVLSQEVAPGGQWRTEIRQRLRSLYLDRALVVDDTGKILEDVRRPGRPGKRDLSPLERQAERKLLATARGVAAGAKPPERNATEIGFKRRVYRRVGERYCLVLVRNDATVEELRLETSLPELLKLFENDPALAYVRVETRGKLVAGVTGQPGSETIELLREIGRGTTVRVGVNLDQALVVEGQASRTALLTGVGLLLIGGAALALVFRLQHAYLERERALRARAEKDRRLASLGRLTGGVAHEIKNPLNTIQLSVSRLRRRMRGRWRRRSGAISPCRPWRATASRCSIRRACARRS